MIACRSGASPASRSPRACRITADLALPGGVGPARPAERLLAEVNWQLDGKGLVLRRGTLINATILEAAVRPPAGDTGEVSRRDPQAGWTKKNGKSRFGYKAHVAVDEGSGLVRKAVNDPSRRARQRHGG